jgi:hypothetical protein
LKFCWEFEILPKRKVVPFKFEPLNIWKGSAYLKKGKRAGPLGTVPAQR